MQNLSVMANSVPTTEADENMMKDGGSLSKTLPKTESDEKMMKEGGSLSKTLPKDGTEEYREMLAKLPLHVQHHPNLLLQYGAQFELTRFNLRRGRENIQE